MTSLVAARRRPRRATKVGIVESRAAYVMAQTDAAQLTLITCLPEDDHSHRVVVVGTLL